MDSVGGESRKKKRTMTPLENLTGLVCDAEWPARIDRKFTAAVVEATLAILPSMEAIEHHGRENTEKNLKQRVSDLLKRRKHNGELKCGIIVSIFWSVIVGCIVELIIRWIMGDRRKRELIQRARA